MPRRSRLSKRIDRQSRKNILLSLTGLIIFLFFSIKFGIPFIADLGFFASRVTNSQNKSVTVDQKIFVSAPSIDPTFQATNSATIYVTGNAPLAKTVRIFLNGNETKEVTPNQTGDFKAKINLSDGQNIIKAKSISGKSESDFSEEILISLKNSAPKLIINSPTDGQNFSKDSSPITVSGNTDPDNQITINGFWAIVDGNGNFNYSLPLQGGGNSIKITVTDSVGNKTEKVINVNYSQ